MRVFKMNNFCLEIRISQAQHAISDFCFVLKTGVFSMWLFSNLFSSKRPPPSIFTRNELFCEHKGLLKIFGFMRLTGDLHQKNFRKIFSSIFCFLKDFQLRKMGFLLFPVEEEWFSRFMRVPSGIFWRCKIDEMLTMSFYPWFSVWYC